MPHDYENLDFEFAEGTPATLFGIRVPFVIAAGLQVFTLKVNEVELTTTILTSATVVADISAQFLTDLGVVAADVDGLLRVTTQQTGETATLEVVQGGASGALGLEGSVSGETHPDSPANWTQETLENDQTEYDPFIFSDPDSPHTETWGGKADIDQKLRTNWFSHQLLMLLSRNSGPGIQVTQSSNQVVLSSP